MALSLTHCTLCLLWEIPLGDAPGSLHLPLYLQLWLWPNNCWRVATENTVLPGKSNSSVVSVQALQSVDVGTGDHDMPAGELS